MTLYDLPAPAKLNLFLHVIGRRPDGYHQLESVFRLVSLADSISIDLRLDGLITRESSVDQEVAAADDLVVRAAQALQKATGTKLGAHIMVTKRIPMGGGLGGGSSDAATVLLALNRLWRTQLKRAHLARIGLSLGADVPFFLCGRNAFVQGIGEQLQPIELPDISYLIFRPPVSVPTNRVFTDPDLTRNTEPVKMLDFSGRARFIGTDLVPDETVSDGSATESAVVCGVSGFGTNDLEKVVVRLFPEVHEAKVWLQRNGVNVRMSGSGSCLFAEFDTPANAELAQVKLTAKMRSVTSDDREEVGMFLRSISACDGLPSHPLLHWVSD
jgi:4-diphosphocytidyl-2-C-methyl-D-erythritol kinase